MAYRQFLKSNGISHDSVEEAEYCHVLESQKIVGQDLDLLADSNNTRDVSELCHCWVFNWHYKTCIFIERLNSYIGHSYAEIGPKRRIVILKIGSYTREVYVIKKTDNGSQWSLKIRRMYSDWHSLLINLHNIYQSMIDTAWNITLMYPIFILLINFIFIVNN